MECADTLDRMTETSLAPAERMESMAATRSELCACLEELDRLGLWTAGAHIASAIDIVDQAQVRRLSLRPRPRRPGRAYRPAH